MAMNGKMKGCEHEEDYEECDQYKEKDDGRICIHHRHDILNGGICDAPLRKVIKEK